MQYELYFDQEVGVVFVQYGETLSKEIIINASKAINSLPDLKPGTPVLVDFRLCTDIDISSDDTREVAKFMARHSETRGFYRIAQLVSTQFMYATSRMSVATLDPNLFEMTVFQAEEEQQAKVWLGLPADYSLPY